MTVSKTALFISLSGIGGLGLGIVLAYFIVVPIFRDTCVFKHRCQSITVQTKPSGELLVKNLLSGLTYWYNGSIIYAYGPLLPGDCSAAVTNNGTGAWQPQGLARKLCLRFDPDGNCVSWDNSESVPSVIAGTYLSKGEALEPAFAMNAFSLQPVTQKTLCSLARDIVTQNFAAAPATTLWIEVPKDNDVLNPVQIFEVLEKKGWFTRPTENPEASICSNHGSFDTLTQKCVCDSGYTGNGCHIKQCLQSTECNSGSCSNKVCVCSPGMLPPDCVNRVCSTPCIYGSCNPGTGTCECAAGVTGAACDEYICPSTCVHGSCDVKSGFCVCDPGWTGVTCANPSCSPGCILCNQPTGICEDEY